MSHVAIKSGVCVFSGAKVRVLEYGRVKMADLFKVGDSIVVRFYGSIHEGKWQDQTDHTHTLVLGLQGYLQESRGPEDELNHLAVVGMASIEGQLRLPDGSTLDLVLGG